MLKENTRMRKCEETVQRKSSVKHVRHHKQRGKMIGKRRKSNKLLHRNDVEMMIYRNVESIDIKSPYEYSKGSFNGRRTTSHDHSKHSNRQIDVTKIN